MVMSSGATLGVRAGANSSTPPPPSDRIDSGHTVPNCTLAPCVPEPTVQCSAPTRVNTKRAPPSDGPAGGSRATGLGELTYSKEAYSNP